MSDKTDKDATNVTGLPKKWDKILKEMPEFKAIAEAADTDELKKIIITAEGNISSIEKSKDDDIKICGAKEVLKDLSTPYRDALKYQMAKIKYSILLLEVVV